MRQSTKIVRQAMDGMRRTIRCRRPKVVLPNREKMKIEMEALIHHFKIITEGFRCGRRSLPVDRISARRLGITLSAMEEPNPTGSTFMAPALATCRLPQKWLREPLSPMSSLRSAAWILCWGHGPLDDLLSGTRARFEKLLKSYPPGRERSAVIPMLLYAQDETGSVTAELSRRSPGAREFSRCKWRSGFLLQHAAA